MATTDCEIQLLQSKASLVRSASLAKTTTELTERVPEARFAFSFKGMPSVPPSGVRIAFFFDGTGNNLEADVGTGEHSNVARLFRAHVRTDAAKGVFAHYIPGIGTRFKEIGDPGGEIRGLAFANLG